MAGSLSKSSAAMAAGAKTQMSNIILAGIVLLTLLVLAPAFQWLPEAALGAVMINAMWGSANPTKIIRLSRVDRIDFALALVTGLLVLAFDLLPAMVAGIILSILYLVYRTSFPGRSILGRDARSGDFEALPWLAGGGKGDTSPHAEAVPGVLIYRFDAPLTFSNAEAFKDSGTQILIDAGKTGHLPPTLVIDFEEVFYTDVSGASALRSLMHFTERYGVKISLARVHAFARAPLELDGVLGDIGEDRVFDTVRDAVAAALAPTGAGK